MVGQREWQQASCVLRLVWRCVMLRPRKAPGDGVARRHAAPATLSCRLAAWKLYRASRFRCFGQQGRWAAARFGFRKSVRIRAHGLFGFRPRSACMRSYRSFMLRSLHQYGTAASARARDRLSERLTLILQIALPRLRMVLNAHRRHAALDVRQAQRWLLDGLQHASDWSRAFAGRSANYRLFPVSSAESHPALAQTGRNKVSRDGGAARSKISPAAPVSSFQARMNASCVTVLGFWPRGSPPPGPKAGHAGRRASTPGCNDATAATRGCRSGSAR